MVGGATPPEDGSALILSLRRMNRLRSISAEDNRGDRRGRRDPRRPPRPQSAAVGRRFPLTLGSRGSCTIGGLIATNAGGTQVLRFGTMRALVAGVEAVLPDGSIHDGLTGLKKDNRGYSLDQLLIGSEGTLGVITAAALKLVPAIAGTGGRLGRRGRPAGRARPAAQLAGAKRQHRRVRDRARGFAGAGPRSISPARAARSRASIAGTC